MTVSDRYNGPRGDEGRYTRLNEIPLMEEKKLPTISPAELRRIELDARKAIREQRARLPAFKSDPGKMVRTALIGNR